MIKRTLLLCEVILLFVAVGTLQAQQKSNYKQDQTFDPTFMNEPGTVYRSGDGTPGPKYWTNKVNYTIHTNLDTQDTTVTGRVQISYTNNSPNPLSYLWLQLDQNLFSKHSIANATMPPGGDRFAKPGNQEFNGGEAVRNVSVKFHGNQYKPKYVINDTRMQVRLKKPVEPDGGKVQLSMKFKFKVPHYGSDRMGLLKTEQGLIYEIAQWYPRMEVYDDIRGWNTLPYIGLGEFYEDYGNFDYYVTVPWDMIVGGSGVLQNPDQVLTKEELKRYKKAQQSDSTVTIIDSSEVGNKNMRPIHHGNLTWHFKMKNSRDVSWAASKAFIWDGAKVNLPSGKKALAMSLYPKESTGKNDWQRSTNMLKRSIEIYSEKFYEFPWKRATSVAGITHGMEYPGIIFNYYSPKSPQGLWSVLTHEIGHDWFPMLVGTNERRNEWMDEGVNTYIDGIASHIYENGKFHYDTGNPTRLAQTMTHNANPQPLDTRPDAMSMDSYGLYYTKTALGLNILRNFVVGKKRFDYAFRSYINAWAYKHPRPKDFFRRINDATGEDLNWFWKEWFYENWKLDQAITNVNYKNQDPDEGALITIQNNDKMVFPVLVKVWQANGKTGTKKLPVEIWQRGGTWTFQYHSTSRIDSVKIDPDMQLPDVDRSNNIWKKKLMKKAPKGETAQKVIQHYIDAIGGEKALKNVKDIMLKSTAMVQGQKVDITEMKKSPDKFSLIVKVPSIGRTVNSIKVNGNDVHAKGPNGNDTKLTAQQRKGYQNDAVMFPELKYLTGEYNLKLLGMKKLSGNDVYVVQIISPSGIKRTIDYNVDNGLKTKEMISQNGHTSTVVYANYKKVNGVMLPYSTTLDQGQGLKLNERVQSAKINSGLKDSNFN